MSDILEPGTDFLGLGLAFWGWVRQAEASKRSAQAFMWPPKGWLRPSKSWLRPSRGAETDERMDVLTDVLIDSPPLFYWTLSPFRADAQKDNIHLKII